MTEEELDKLGESAMIACVNYFEAHKKMAKQKGLNCYPVCYVKSKEDSILFAYSDCEEYSKPLIDFIENLD